MLFRLGGFEVPAFPDCRLGLLRPFLGVGQALEGCGLRRVAFQPDFNPVGCPASAPKAIKKGFVCT
jgi:hypothetical protein